MKQAMGFLVVLAGAVPCGAGRADGIVQVVPLEKVAGRCDHLVRGRIDLRTGRLEVRRVYGPGRVPAVVQVRNLSDLPRAKPRVDRPHEALLCLDELDGRHYLVDRWAAERIHPRSAIKFLGPGGALLGFHPGIFGTPLVLKQEGVLTPGRERRLAALRRERPERPRPPALTPAEADMLYAVIEPWVGLYALEVEKEPGPRLEPLMENLAPLVGKERGLLGRRAVRAFLVLARQSGCDQRRRRAVESRLRALVEEKGAKAFIPALLECIRSRRVRANKRTAGALLGMIGGPAKTGARRALLEIMAQGGSHLADNAYHALVRMGCRAGAERAAKRRRQ